MLTERKVATQASYDSLQSRFLPGQVWRLGGTELDQETH